jgi:hypothetical protein
LATAVTNSSKIAPVNVEMTSFAAEQSEERLDHPASPFASNEGVFKTPSKTHKAKVPMKYNKFRKQYSIADTWLNGNIAKYQQKLSGRRSADFKFLYPYLECSTCELVKYFQDKYTHLEVRSVWLIEKLKENNSFQGWHRDFYLEL